MEQSVKEYLDKIVEEIKSLPSYREEMIQTNISKGILTPTKIFINFECDFFIPLEPEFYNQTKDILIKHGFSLDFKWDTIFPYKTEINIILNEIRVKGIKELLV